MTPPAAPLRGLILALIVLMASAGCAPDRLGDDPADPDRQVTIEVNNDLLPTTALTVWFVPEVGSRQMLGTVNPGDAEAFQYEVGPAAGQSRLMARTTGGREIVSDPFVPVPGETVRWSLSANVVR